MRNLTVAIALVSGLLAGSASAHEFWIEPLAYQVGAEGRLEGRLVNGQQFAGVNIPYLPQRFVSFEVTTPGGTVDVEGRIGDTPALQMDAPEAGLNVVTHVTTVSRVNYDEYDAFLRFAEHKDFGDIEARHEARSLPTDEFGEAYTRFVKALIGVGDAEGSDSRTGMETEIVALANPYTDDLSEGMPVEVWYGDEVRADTQVELFDKAPDGAVEITYHRTDAEGVAMLPVTPGHSYLVDAVVLREPSEELAAERDVVWETLWAALTFAVPE